VVTISPQQKIELIPHGVGGAPLMKLSAIVVVATCCYALLDVPAAAQVCDERYPGSCPVDVSTTTVGTNTHKPLPKGTHLPTAAISVPMPRPSPRRMLPAATVSVPLPPPSPRRMTAASRTKPTTLVEEAFQSLTLNESVQRALEAALIKRRDHILGLVPR
jgi:hypothetical protein